MAQLFKTSNFPLPLDYLALKKHSKSRMDTSQFTSGPEVSMPVEYNARDLIIYSTLYQNNLGLLRLGTLWGLAQRIYWKLVLFEVFGTPFAYFGFWCIQLSSPEQESYSEDETDQ